MSALDSNQNLYLPNNHFITIIKQVLGVCYHYTSTHKEFIINDQQQQSF